MIEKQALTSKIKQWGQALGFQQVGITPTDLGHTEQYLQEWLAKNYHGEMDFMHKHGLKRTRPALLEPNTRSIISLRMDYYPPAFDSEKNLQNPQQAFISRYALGRDYHKLIRKRIQKLAQKITTEIGDFGYRAYTDSAPVMEKPIAQQAGLGWIGKHSNLINSKAGSWFFLGELYTDIDLNYDAPAENHCGSCQNCIDICPTKAIVEPYIVDARRCISYLTIELKGAIPIEFRSQMGNHIYGCDDCQICCPWNKFAQTTEEKDFYPRNKLDTATLIALFAWSEPEFLKKTEGSAIRRIGHQRWLRNISIALGNSISQLETIMILKQKYASQNPLIQEHIDWAIQQLQKRM